jgi:4-hydroxybenzoate polyprenyltransferase
MVKNYLSLVKFSHTIFALPFAMVGCFLGFQDREGGWDLGILLLVILCMVFARSAAMAFNRWLDRDIDSANPRTAIREIPSGLISQRSALIFVIISAVLFVLTTFFINDICFYLSPVALLVILGYSYTKRFTSLCHLVLGLGLSLAPVGAYLAAVGVFSMTTIFIGVAVLFWVAGFDIVYALQDEDYDRSKSLNSIPVALGTSRSIMLSIFFHIVTLCALSLAVYLAHQQYVSLGWVSYVGLVVFVGLLIYQHSIISPTDLSRINMAFFTTNGLASLVFGSLFIIDLLW